ncbi:MAG: DNA-binding domain-containing protein [Candidatus Thioglobus sp.]|uniref:HvfC/BufC N-terminal domain-containing protein n=1 Tax=Candidatus Thioglobus sp. TaxID=2026721 RepID=UPI00263217CF|nr:DNA-binding domain-containing protein [Candidatus Thioglobus sp.]MDC9727516.1 DNA-binding domain-containing protein [Candidatus Thioglobus sp.]
MLKKLQQDFYQDILDPNKAKNYLDNANFTGSDLIKIYHNQYFISMTQALASSYSCVKRLVGEEFFNMLAHQFIKKHPSKSASIIDYGHEFSVFIKTNEHCKNMAYLADIAKLENLYECCYFSLNAVFFMQSDYPVVEIWQLNDNSEQLDLSSGKVYLKFYKEGGSVIVEKITKQEFENGKNN